MSDFWNDKRLHAAVDQARAAVPAGVLDALPAQRQERLHDRVWELRELIRSGSLDEAHTQLRLAGELVKAQASIANPGVPRTRAHETLLSALSVTFSVAFVVGVAGYPIVGAVWGWDAPWRWLQLRAVQWVVALSLLLLVLTGSRLFFEGRRHRAATDARRAELLQQNPLEQMAQRVAQAEEAALQRGVVAAGQLWRRALAEFTEPSYAMHLQRGNEAGVNIAFDKHLVVDTPARSRLQRLIHTLRGGSIGIAGPRGAGKTTLIQSLCGAHVKKLGDRPVLPVLTSAPVDYQTRDFLLHLFATLCQAVIERYGQAGDPLDARRPPAADHETQRTVLRWLWIGSVVALALGAVLFWLALVMGNQMAQAQQTAARGAPGAAAVAASSVSASASAPTPGSGPGLAKGPVPVPAPVPASAASVGSAAVSAAAASAASATAAPASATSAQASADGLAALVASASAYDTLLAMGVTPGKLLSSALMLWALGVAVAAVVRVRALAMQKHLRKPAAVDVAAVSPTDEQPPLWFGGRPFIYLRQTWRAIQPVPQEDGEDALVRQAVDWLREIKFQQSWTMGQSGTLKTPLGVEAGISQARQMAQAQLTLPEIADGLKRFVGRVATERETSVLIGIDELDKIASDERAQAFLNDIKVVFGVRNVFFLVSVSENAMSQFERRGLPFRDAFDSAFDEVVAVRHLDFTSAALMLGERVIGMPVPFQALCWVLSGGLARELVRSARNLVERLPTAEAGEPAPPGELGSIVEALVRLEVAAKSRAVVHAAEQLAGLPGTVELLRLVDTLPLIEHLDTSGLLRLHEAVLVLAERPRAPAPLRRLARASGAASPTVTLTGRAAPHDDNSAVRALAAELAAYLLYLAGVLHFFDRNTLTEARLKDALQERGVHENWLGLLVSGLRLIAVHPDLARARLAGFFERSGAPLGV